MTLIGCHYGFAKHVNEISREAYMHALKVSCVLSTHRPPS